MCSAYPMFGVNGYLAQMMICENVEILNRYRPKKILAACPHCCNTIKNEYPQFGARYEVVHHSDFLLELVHFALPCWPTELRI